ncbi:hypothetical protein [Absidia glauca]|uniref:Amino acid permease/ SLC12A domain-containing protein n=1 Tax=Absidia glauca TaxID=4829 RepID=A0A168KVN3_ABSGL|nr:hypothetical protein [Absidia glauca]
MADIENIHAKTPDQIDKLAPLAVGDQKLNRHLGYFSGTMINIGQIIGTGIFSNPALILQNTGSGGMMLILWVIGALTAVSGLAVFMELGTMLPRRMKCPFLGKTKDSNISILPALAEKEYLAYAFPHPRQLTAFVFMIMIGVFSRGGGLAQGSLVFGNNIVYSISAGTYKNDWYARGFGVFCITFWILVNIFSAKLAIRFNNFFTVLKITLLVLLICVGFAGMAGRLPERPNFEQNFSFDGTLNNAGSYANAIYYVIFSYGGYYNLQKVTDELKDPIKNLPRCGVSALGLTTVLYLLANVAYLSVLPLDEIRSSDLTVAANLFSKAFGGIFGSRVLPVFVGLSSFGFVGVVTYSGSRVILEFARQGHLPFGRFFSRVHPKLHTPIASLGLLYVITLIFLLAPPPGTAFQFIMAFSNYGDYFFAALCGIGLLLLRRSEPNTKRPIRAPIPLVVFYLLICVFTLVFVYIPPTSAPSAYPYWVPYIASIVFGLICIGLWYIKMVRYDGLENSYNTEIRKEGQLELYKDVFQDYQSSGTTISSHLATPASTSSIGADDDSITKHGTKSSGVHIREIDQAQ